ncbi:hypothetical protein [Ruania alba]|uniref:Uncharacterized protein n=1 Tax=Ruania alba TaxID=648782 RepID=A0A1H5N5N1_9MICO|nr:hypothetical protein [Ruania alba]SEE96929.1 hypothetical protein SAMN04488554_3973 [Ruania alba]
MRMLLGEVLQTAGDLPWTHALYASAGNRTFDESVPVLVCPRRVYRVASLPRR